MAAYLIVNYNVENPELYGEYQGGAAPALKVGEESKILVFDPASESIEGTPGAQTVVLEFESMEKAREIYESGAYQAVVGKRHEATSNHFAVLVNGFG